MWSEDVILMILNGVKETLYMTLASTILGYVLGLPMKLRQEFSRQLQNAVL